MRRSPAKIANAPQCRHAFALKHSAVMMSARKHASQWTCRAPARDAGKAKSSKFDRPIVPIPSTQRTLIARLRDPADEVAWQRFEDQYRELVVRFTMRQGLQAADAEDVAQAVFAALMSAMKSFVYDSKRGRFRNYLFRAIRNEIPRQIAKSRCPTDGTQVLHMSVGQRIPDDRANKRGARAIQNGVQNKQANEVSNRGRLARGNMWLGMLGIV